MEHQWGDGQRLGDGGSITVVVPPDQNDDSNDLEIDANPLSDLSQEENMLASSEITTGTENLTRNGHVQQPDSDKKESIEVLIDEKDPSEIEIEIAEEKIPPHLKVEQRDYVLFFCDTNRDGAENLHEKLVNMGYKGVFYNDATCLGYNIGSEMSLPNELTKHCTYKLFYVTENFKRESNSVIAMHKDELLMKTLMDPKQRWTLVPIFCKPKSSFHPDDVPYGLLGLNGLVESDQKYFERGAKGLFTNQESVKKKKERTEQMLEEKEKWVENEKEREMERRRAKMRDKKREQEEKERRQKMREELEKENEEKREAEFQESLRREKERIIKENSKKEEVFHQQSGDREHHHFHEEGAAYPDKDFDKPPPYEDHRHMPGPSQPAPSKHTSGGQTIYNVKIQCATLGDLHLGDKISTSYGNGIETDEYEGDQTSSSQFEIERSDPSDDEKDDVTPVDTNTHRKLLASQVSSENYVKEQASTQNEQTEKGCEMPYPGYKPEDHTLDFQDEKKIEKCDDRETKVESMVPGGDEQSFHLSFSEGKSMGEEDHSPDIKNMAVKDSCLDKFIPVNPENNTHQGGDQGDQNFHVSRNEENELLPSKNYLELKIENDDIYEGANNENPIETSKKKDYTESGKSPEGTPV